MKKIFLSLLCTGALALPLPAVAQGPAAGTLNALLGPQGPVNGLLLSLQQGNLQPLIDGVTSNVSLVQGDIAVPLNNTLSGLLVKFDLGQTINGLQDTLSVTVGSLAGGLLGGNGGLPIVGGLLGGDGGIPVAGGLLGGEGSLPIVGGLLSSNGGIPVIGGLLGGDGGLPIVGGLLGGEGGIPIVGGLLGGGALALPVSGQRLTLDEIPLPTQDLDTGTLTGLLGGATLAGL